MGRLSNLEIKHAKPGRHVDGKGLCLVVKPSGSKSWVLRVQHAGRRRDLGLGSLDVLDATEARAKAAEWRKSIKQNRDPAAEAKAAKQGLRTFKEAALQYHQAVKAGWKNEKHADQWLATLKAHAFPQLGNKSVSEIDAAAIQAALLPIWLTLPETARRVRQRIAAVLDYSHSQGWRESEAPMRAVAKGLPLQPKKSGHFAAMPYAELPAFMAELRSKDTGMGNAALQFAILTAARSGEVRGAKWSEINLAKKIWTVPASRMKAGVEHAVPLNDAALALLREAEDWRAVGCDLVFPGNKAQPLSDMTLSKVLRTAKLPYTVHGFRSTFRDWAAEKQPTIPGEVAEAALAHTIPNKVEAAYRRTKFIEQRRALMQKWAHFLKR